MAILGILIGGENVLGPADSRIVLNKFAKTVIGPIVFELSQRRGDDGIGNGTVLTLLKVIIADQIARGRAAKSIPPIRPAAN